MPRWLTARIVLALHEEQLARFGGGSGLRDMGLLESALAKAPNTHNYEPNASIFELAACYGFGIARNHPFVDGNKRASVLSIAVFLHLNDYDFDPEQGDEVNMILKLAAGDLSQDDLADWIERNSTPRNP